MFTYTDIIKEAENGNKSFFWNAIVTWNADADLAEDEAIVDAIIDDILAEDSEVLDIKPGHVDWEIRCNQLDLEPWQASVIRMVHRPSGQGCHFCLDDDYKFKA